MEVNVYGAKTQLSRLLDRAAAGEETVRTRNGRPVARLVRTEEPSRPRELGQLRGKIAIADDFDAPPPEDLQRAFEGRG